MSSKTPQASSSTSHCPFWFSRFSRPLASHGRHSNASPATSKTPDPSVILTPLLRWNPSQRHASMAVDGVGVAPSTSRALKSVCVVSLLGGPRSRDLGGCECDCAKCRYVVLCRQCGDTGCLKVVALVRPLCCCCAKHVVLGPRTDATTSRMLGLLYIPLITVRKCDMFGNGLVRSS
jgi:hypothetical protein